MYVDISTHLSYVDAHQNKCEKWNLLHMMNPLSAHDYTIMAALLCSIMHSSVRYKCMKNSF